jgi:hypothetical protein
MDKTKKMCMRFTGESYTNMVTMLLTEGSIDVVVQILTDDGLPEDLIKGIVLGNVIFATCEDDENSLMTVNKKNEGIDISEIGDVLQSRYQIQLSELNQIIERVTRYKSDVFCDYTSLRANAVTYKLNGGKNGTETLRFYGNHGLKEDIERGKKIEKDLNKTMGSILLLCKYTGKQMTSFMACSFNAPEIPDLDELAKEQNYNPNNISYTPSVKDKELIPEDKFNEFHNLTDKKVTKQPEPELTSEQTKELAMEHLSINEFSRDTCDSAWIAPDGTFYTIKGTTSYFYIHRDIENLLIDAQIIPSVSEVGYTENYLEKQEWVKLSINRWISKVNPYTEAQIQTMKKYLTARDAKTFQTFTKRFDIEYLDIYTPQELSLKFY